MDNMDNRAGKKEPGRCQWYTPLCICICSFGTGTWVPDEQLVMPGCDL